jgi:hypothetical protein
MGGLGVYDLNRGSSSFAGSLMAWSCAHSVKKKRPFSALYMANNSPALLYLAAPCGKRSAHCAMPI